MLRLKNIKKVYKVADLEVNALKGIDLSFRKNEFVSILGPSGCGKTTLLNIIGGLDKYSRGDLFINHKSTKEFSDRDWDIYRNHRVGFIFQSYNLIPHQNILGNVELSLTIAGIGKEERTKRAKEALDRVGLKGLYNKKPNQLSGGQCQRVAIARALVNEPEILLADEPTGALDTETSIQIMELIKEISKEKLVIMVTHNPELAYKYSSRIIKLLDGNILEDSNPYSEDEEVKEKVSSENISEKAKMSMKTAFKLSLKNLLSKRGRTIMTCVAGSIGIIGISMVLAVSSGIKGYIKNMQDDMLSGNPIQITEVAFDMNAVSSMMSTTEKVEFIKDVNEVGVEYALEQIIDKMDKSQNITKTNVITKEYVDYIKAMPSEYASCTNFGYGVDFSSSIYTNFKPLNGEYTTTSLTAIKESYGQILSHVDGMGEYASLIPSLINAVSVAPDNEEYIKSQYNVLTGKVATKKNEIMLVVNKDKNATDLILAEMGIYTQKDYIETAMKIKKGEEYNKEAKFTYDDILNQKLCWYGNDLIFDTNKQNKYLGASAIYNYNEAKILEYATNNNLEINNDNKIELKIVGILQPKEDINYGCLTSGFYVTSDLVDHSIKVNKDSKIVSVANEFATKYEGANGIVNSITQNPYMPNSYIYTGVLYDYSYYYYDENEAITKDPTNAICFVSSTSSTGALMSLMGTAMPGGGAGAGQSQTVQAGSLSVRSLGGNDLPSSISIYPVNFEQKDLVTDYLDLWNSKEDIVLNGNTIKISDREEISYTDSVGLIIGMVNTLIDIITYALVAFTSLSLVVSCAMIAIITYVSVMERIKEIGVIRSLGGRKKDVSHLFNAETFMIGLTSGVIGIAFTYLVSFVANLAFKSLIGVSIFALPISQAIIMIVISVLLTCISGLIPSSSAAKKDPVNALRSE